MAETHKNVFEEELRKNNEKMRSKLRELTSKKISINAYASNECEVHTKTIGIKSNRLFDCNYKTHEYQRLEDFYPRNVGFSELAKQMTPVTLDGFDCEGAFCDIKDGDIRLVPEETSDIINTSDYKETGLPYEGSLAIVYVAMFIEGSEGIPFSDSWSGEPSKFILGESSMPGITIACRSLRPGQLGLFLLPPKLMYGKVGCYPNVPGSATILALVYMIKWLDFAASKRYNMLDDNAKKNFKMTENLVEKVHMVGVHFYKNKEYQNAIKSFEKLVSMISNCEITKYSKEKLKQLKYKTFLNLSLCHLKVKNIDMCFACLNEASVLDCKNKCKYYFIKGKCLLLQEDYEEGYKLLIEALKIEPFNTEIGTELFRVEKIIMDQRIQEKNIFQKMFNSIENKNKTTDISDLKEKVRNVYEKLQTTELCSIPIPMKLNTSDKIKLLEIMKEFDDFTIEHEDDLEGNTDYSFVIPSRKNNKENFN